MSTVAIERKPCSRCGKETDAEIPEDLREASERNRRRGKGIDFVEVLERVGILCDPCRAEVEAEQRAEDERVREAERRMQRRDYVKLSNVPPTLREVRFEHIAVDDAHSGLEGAKADCEAWAQGGVRAVVLSGPVGVGKTYLAAAAANAMLERRALRWFSAARLMAQARAGFANPSREEVTELLTNPRLALVLDDIDKINPSPYAVDIIFELIDERLTSDTPILITTNMRHAELKTQFGEAIASRLKLCRGHRIEGPDRRRAAA